MAEPVEWLPDGTPRSRRFQDIYRSSTGGLEQARRVFLGGCGLPGAWAGQPQWRILETGFGLGLNFLAAWRAWKDDPQRPRLLHFVSAEAWPVAAEDLLRSAAPYPELVPLAQALAEQWFGLVAGTHRMVFEQGRVLLTLFVGDVRDALRQQPFDANSIFLDGFAPQHNPAMWELRTLKAVARHCRRGTRMATWTVAGEVRRDLAQCGFVVDKTEGLAPKRHSLTGVFAPAWEPRRRQPQRTVVPGRCVVVGSGLAGASAAASLARRGWQVTVLDEADAPAAGASSLPAGLIAPHFSVDDSLLSRLSRSGVRATLQEARTLLRHGQDWQASGVLEHRVHDTARDPNLPAANTPEPAQDWSRPADPPQKAAAWLDPEAVAYWHRQGGWIKPAALVQAWLSQPGVRWRGRARVDRLVRSGNDWRLTDAQGRELEQADLVVVAAAHASANLLDGRLTLQPVRGQVSWGEQRAQLELPPFPLNGNGHFIPHVPLGSTVAWFCGSTYGRGETDLAPRKTDHQENLTRLGSLLPAVEQQLIADFSSRAVKAWTGVRCASADRRPLLGELEPGLWVSTAMGSRGMTFAVLCAELLAARLHGEPLPLERRLAASLDALRHQH
ncbi:MAG TPA: FAD-dependent 5-carboxymethylaminomethyl-2-thiouridine(34) oxidoreductase MnmC [Ramlibacter sp.]|nr:FAD-dependent 5-carboxymethylaminomethyl-2-thiouridine(34) oxidoreductase MnmC [Ramlibacter sp.]